LRIFRHGLARSIRGVLRGLLRGHPLQVGWFHNAAQSAAIRRGIGDVDLGYCYYIRSAEAMRGLSSHAATFLAMQLSQTLNTRRMAAHFRNLRQRLIYAVESRLLPGYEARIWQDFTRTVLIGPKDVEEIRGICRQNGVAEIDNVVFGPHGVDVARFAPPDGVAGDGVAVEPFSLVFNGVLRTYTNVHAITWFADHVWPLVREGEARATLMIVGREPRAEVRALAARPGITVTGEVPDPAVYIRRATLCIDPVQAGAGMQNKLVEFMAAAKPVVATTVANEGIGATVGEHLVLADTPADFATAVLDLFGDADRRRALGEAARAFATERWSWEGRFLELEAEMIRAVDERVKDGPA
jgi:glycosyltransferase involved in cell wall biosynthesis